MIIIGEKINGSIPSVREAIARRDDAFIRDLAVKQTLAGADYLDIAAGTAPEVEAETIQWLIETVQEVSDTPLCIDSPNPRVLKEMMPFARRSGILNSVSGEGDKCGLLYPLLENNDWMVVALACNDKGIPTEADEKAAIAIDLIEKAADYGIAPGRILLDPLVMALAAVNSSMLSFMEAVKQIKGKYPTVKITSGLSNISYGMPVRKLINQNFMTLAMLAGMDTAIADPLNRDIMSTIYAAEALLGLDKNCRRYNTAFRAGKLGPVKQ